MGGPFFKIPMKDKLPYFLGCLFIRFVRLLPFGVGVWIGSLLGGFYYLIDPRHRNRTLGHLQLAFGREKNPQKLKQIAWNSYRNMGRSIAESIYLPSLSLSHIKQWVRVDGLSHYIEARNQGKGVIILTAHLGNWEIIPKAFWSYGFRIHATVRPLDNPYINQMVQDWREKNGMGVLNKRTDAHRILKLLKDGETIGFLLDQNTVEEDAVFVDFFGEEAATHKGVAILALRSGAPVLPVFITRERSGHRMAIGKPLPIHRTGSHSDDIVKVTASFTQTIESIVAHNPDQWLWVHRRWRTKRTKGGPA